MNRGRERKPERVAGSSRALLLALMLASAVGLGTLALLAPATDGARGDEPTYLAMVESLVSDGDLSFAAEDAERRSGRPKSVILQRAEGGRVFYSKPALYPLFCAPFVAFGGAAGFPLANLAVLAAALVAAWRTLRSLGSATDAGLTLLSFLAPSASLFYLTWKTADVFQFALALGGLALVVGARREVVGRRSGGVGGAIFGGLCLGLLAALRFPNGIVALAAVAGLVLARRRRRAAAVLLATLVGFGASLLLNDAVIGAANPYKAVRASFNPQIGFPAGSAADVAAAEFDEQRKTVRMGVAPALQPSLSAYSSLYFLVGRHTGLLFYFPAAIWLAAVALRRPDRLGLALVAGVAALTVFYLVWLPQNYFGGGTFIGNRYFLSVYPVLLLAPRRLLPRGALAAIWGVAAVVTISAALSLARAAPLERSSQLHAYAGIFRLLPFESTAENLDGPRQRYWSDEALWFADPYARVEAHGFHLSSERPAAELMLASGRQRGHLRFLVQADAPAARIRYRDWRAERVVELAAARGEGIASGLVEVEASPAWRRHRFPWSEDESWRAWVFRLAVESADGRPVEAELRYLGPYRTVGKFYSHQTLALELPRVVAAGSRQRLAVRALNRGRRPWSSRADVPVHLRYRLEPLDGGPPIVSPVSRLPAEVPHRDILDGSIRVRWPKRPGRYRMTVDLVLGGTVWFETIGGQPLARGEVEVRPAVASAGRRGRLPR